MAKYINYKPSGAPKYWLLLPSGESVLVSPACKNFLQDVRTIITGVEAVWEGVGKPDMAISVPMQIAQELLEIGLMTQPVTEYQDLQMIGEFAKTKVVMYVKPPTLYGYPVEVIPEEKEKSDDAGKDHEVLAAEGKISAESINVAKIAIPAKAGEGSLDASKLGTADKCELCEQEVHGAEGCSATEPKPLCKFCGKPPALCVCLSIE